MVSERRAFGERLRQQRERCGISLASISQSTKVPASLYAGLERGDCSRWPTGIYGRAYIKAYAEAVGLNAADTVHEFSVVFGGTATPRGTAKAERTGPLRLSMAEEPSIRPELIARRAALAATELVIGGLIAALAIVGMDASPWTSAGGLLAYFVIGRIVSDDPLLFWAYRRARTRGSAAHSARELDADEDVAVAGAARTTA